MTIATQQKKAKSLLERQLLDAVSSNNFERVRELLLSGADINAQGSHGETPLLKSLLCEDHRIFRLLLDGGADPDMCTNSGYSALAFSCLQNNFEHVRILLSRGAKLTVKTQEGWTPLQFAVTNPNLFFYNVDSDFYCQLMEIMYKYAHYFPDYNPVRIVKLLLESGADPNNSDIYGLSPLMAASGTANHQTIRLLLKAGAAVNLHDTDGKSALMHASIATIEDVINSFIHLRLVGSTVTSADFISEPNFVRLRQQFEPQKEFCVHELIRSGADVNDTDQKGIPVIAYASSAGNLNIVKNLVAHGGDMHTQSPRGITGLYAAAIHGHDAIVEYFLNEGIDVDTRLSNGETPLMGAVWSGKVSTVQLLIQYGADVNAKKNIPYQDTEEKGILTERRHQRREESENYDKILRLLADSGAT